MVAAECIQQRLDAWKRKGGLEHWHKVRRKAEEGNPNHVAAPMPGVDGGVVTESREAV